MTTRARLLAALVLLGAIALAVLWLVTPRNHKPVARSADASSIQHPVSSILATPLTSKRSSSDPATSSTASVDASDADPRSLKPEAVQPPARRRSLAALEQAPAGPEIAPGLTPAVVLENVRGAFRQYHSRFGGNPVGTNREMTASLNGGNPSQVVFVNPEDGLRLNEQGELIDNWGTPFFFHQLSATDLEIHSAGPDRSMWTADDLVMK